MRLTELSLLEVEKVEKQTDPRQDLEPAMIAGGRKSNLNYTEKKVKNVLDRVTLELTGKNSEITTKLAKRYKHIDDLEKQLKTLRDSFNLDAKQHILQYFDAEDEVLTRVIETASMTLTLSKKTSEEKETIQFEGFYKELLGLLPELEDKLKILLDKYTKIETVERSPSLRVKLGGANEAAGDNGFWSKITSLGNSLLKVFKVWGKQYDKKLEFLKQKMGEFAVGESNEHPCYADNPLAEDALNRAIVETKNYEIIPETRHGMFLKNKNSHKGIFFRMGDENQLKFSDDYHKAMDYIESHKMDVEDANEVLDRMFSKYDTVMESKLTEGKNHGFADGKDLLELAHKAKNAAREVHVKLNELEMLALRVASHKEAGSDIDFEYVMANKFKHLSIEAEKIWDDATALYFEVEERVNGGGKKSPLSVSESIEVKDEEELEKLISLANRLKK
jgi:hypothetical protein